MCKPNGHLDMVMSPGSSKTSADGTISNFVETAATPTE